MVDALFCIRRTIALRAENDQARRIFDTEMRACCCCREREYRGKIQKALQRVNMRKVRAVPSPCVILASIIFKLK